MKNEKQKPNIVIEDKEIMQVDKFKYLGRIMNKKGNV